MIWCYESERSQLAPNSLNPRARRYFVKVSCKCGCVREVTKLAFLSKKRPIKCKSCEPRDYNGAKNPMYGKKRPDLLAKNLAGLNTRFGKANGMFGKKRPDFALAALKYRNDLKLGIKISPRKGKKPNHGRIVLYKNIKFRSRWEALFAIVLDYFGQPWTYEAYTFPLIVNGKRCSYTPDFYIESLDIVIEVKGYIYEPFQLEKIDEFKRQFGGPSGFWFMDANEFRKMGFLTGNSLNKIALSILSDHNAVVIK